MQKEEVMNSTSEQEPEKPKPEVILTDLEFRTYAISELRRVKHWADLALQEIPGLRGERRIIECISTQVAYVEEVGRRRPAGQ
jgi:hypothetical protein